MTIPASNSVQLLWNVNNPENLEVFVTVASVGLQWNVNRGEVAHVSASVGLLWNVEPVDQPQLNQDFMTDVDEAMKFKVSGLRVSDTRTDGSINTRAVRTYFRRPQKEITDQTYPYITVDMLRIVRASAREQRGGGIALPYTPKGYTAPDNNPSNLKTASMPIPLDFIFQLTSFARTYQHDRQIREQMWDDDVLPPRFGWLPVGPTWRYLDLIDGPTQADTVGGPGMKRIFRSIWTASVSGELFQSDIYAIARTRKIVTDVLPIEAVSSDVELDWQVSA